MKIYKKLSLIVAFASMIILGSCKKLLVETPRTGLYPSFLQTQAGLFAAITGVLSDERNNLSQQQNLLQFYSGTDEQLNGGSASTPVYATYNGMVAGATNGAFNVPYQDINTLNGVIQYAPNVTMDAGLKAQYVAQAQFLRGWLYSLLIAQFGGTTTSVGINGAPANTSGIALHTTFVTAATSADQPATLAALYQQIINDFTAAAAVLPNTKTGTNPFTGTGQSLSAATSGLANAYLAKAYLCRGYSAAAQSTDFQQAATITNNLITNQGTYGYGLYPDYTQAVAQANDYGKENMFGLDMGTDPTYGGFSTNSSGGKGVNQIALCFRWNYITVSGVNSNNQVPQLLNGGNVMLRDMYNGRPYTLSYANTPYTINYAFADQTHDSRFDADFQIFWICNVTSPAGKDLNGKVKPTLIPTTPVSLTSYIIPTNGDTAILMPQGPRQTPHLDSLRRNNFKGQLTTTDQYSPVCFPTVKKFDDAVGRLAQNDFSTRPLVLMRFSEVYMMNAEANYMLGNTAGAAASLNVIRQRAAYRTPADGATIPKSQYSVTAANMAAANTANAAAMTLTPAQLAQLAIPYNNTVGGALNGMDLILDEYTREYYGDPRRWLDLVRIGYLAKRLAAWEPQIYTNFKPYMVLRPIPLDVIQAVLTGPKYPQNTGY
jgi:hypothetical protein